MGRAPDYDPIGRTARTCSLSHDQWPQKGVTNARATDYRWLDGGLWKEGPRHPQRGTLSAYTYLRNHAIALLLALAFSISFSLVNLPAVIKGDAFFCSDEHMKPAYPAKSINEFIGRCGQMCDAVGDQQEQE